MLRNSPGFAAVAILTLVLGIGANTAIFSLIDAVMLRALPVDNPSELVLLKWSARNAPNIHGYHTSGDCPMNVMPGAANPYGCSFSEPMFRCRCPMGNALPIRCFGETALATWVTGGSRSSADSNRGHRSRRRKRRLADCSEMKCFTVRCRFSMAARARCELERLPGTGQLATERFKELCRRRLAATVRRVREH